MHLKTGFYVLCYLIVVPFFISCLGDGDSYDTVIPDDAEILAFSLAHDSFPELKRAKFTIDQRNNRIYNYDSLSYQTLLSDSVIVQYITSLSSSGVNVLNITDGDSIFVQNGDSLNVSKPLRFRVYAWSAEKTKEYDIWVNIHQVDPDSIQYAKIADVDFLSAEDNKTVRLKDDYYTFSKSTDGIISLYESDNMKDWENKPLVGLPNSIVISGILSDGIYIYACTEESAGGELYRSSDAASWEKISCEFPVISILGHLPQSRIQSEGLSIVVRKEGVLFPMFITGNGSQLGVQLSDDFPTSRFSTVNSQVTTVERITLVGGTSYSNSDLNTVWSTQDGLYWAKLSGGDSRGAIPLLGKNAISGANAFLYNNELYLLNGVGADSYNYEIYRSKDGGVTWSLAEEKCSFPNNYPLRHNASIVLDSTGACFYIVGGRNSNACGDIWRAFINRKTFVNN